MLIKITSIERINHVHSLTMSKNNQSKQASKCGDNKAPQANKSQLKIGLQFKDPKPSDDQIKAKFYEADKSEVIEQIRCFKTAVSSWMIDKEIPFSMVEEKTFRKMFEHFKQLWMGIWQNTHTVTTTEVSPVLVQLLCRTSHVARLLLVKIIQVETILESTQEFKKS